MSGHGLGGLLLGALTVGVGLAWLAGALRYRKQRAEHAANYAATGGIFYTAVQIGCAGVLLVLGLGLLVVGVLVR